MLGLELLLVRLRKQRVGLNRGFSPRMEIVRSVGLIDWARRCARDVTRRPKRPSRRIGCAIGGVDDHCAVRRIDMGTRMARNGAADVALATTGVHGPLASGSQRIAP